MRSAFGSRRWASALAAALSVAAGMTIVAPASGAETAWWQLAANAKPTIIKPGQEGTIVIEAVDVGNAPIRATTSPVTISDVLPAGLTAVSARGEAGIANFGEGEGIRGPVNCTPGATVTCTWEGPELLQPFELLEIFIKVKASETPGTLSNSVSISGGVPIRCTKLFGGEYSGPFCKLSEVAEGVPGHYERESTGLSVPPASVTRPIVVKDEETSFGLADLGLSLEGEGGEQDTQAGSHPFQFTTQLAFNQGESLIAPPAFAKDFQLTLPPGLIGNAQATGKCTEAQFSQIRSGNSNVCPPDSALGVATIRVLVNIAGFSRKAVTLAVPVFNLVPAPGEPARLGFEVEKTPVVVDTSVRTGSDYAIVTHVSNISEFAVLLSGNIVIWGVPGEAAHRLSHGWSCIAGGFFREREENLPACEATGETQPKPFLRAPTSCTGQLTASAEVDSWQEPGSHLLYEPKDFGHSMQTLDGCGLLPFNPQFSVAPDSHSTSSPTGLSVNIHENQEANENPAGLASADIRSTSITLPEGFTLNASSANGLEACSEGEIGYLPGASSSQQKVFTAALPEPFCPTASKVGTVKINVPVLTHPLEGAMYLAAQDENPFGGLVATYIVARDPVSGVLVKLAGKVDLDETTGRIVATFENTPQAPIEDLEVHLFSGPLAPLSTPTHCGAYTTSATLSPWSGNASESTSASSDINSGVGGSPCPVQLPFAPSLAGGTTTNRGGSFSPLTTTVAREDGNQSIETVTLHLPLGLTALLASVNPCEEAQANAGTCGAESLIGHTSVSAGVGSDPVTVNGGQVFITGPYKGAPFGLSIVVPAKAGPFNLGTVVVRASLSIDRHTAQATVTTDAIPRILKGIPIQLKRINVVIDRPGFAINPTNCHQLELSGSLSSYEGGSLSTSVPFQAVNCATLAFAPKFTATLNAHSTKANGASLKTKLTMPNVPIGTESNIAKAKVVLPIQLPTRQSTLNQACLAHTFEVNPAACPSGSLVGHGVARTPILPVPLVGPAYLVSHGGESFPTLTVVLQGDGVTYELVGNTLIRKGITSSSFKTVADVPVTSFELTLPAGKYSLLTSYLPSKDKGSFCGTKLTIPTAFVAQNGLETHQTTPIAVSGCATKKAKAKAKKHASKKARRK
jgi:hypothetical protein